MHTVVKSILNIGTLIVFLMAHEWMKRDDTSFKQGEFYVLTLSTLFGMYLMISAGHFLMFFIGLETASIPMAALIAFDKYRHNSAEAGAKYILTALFSSALLLFGLSMIYGSAGTLYFDDLPAHIDGNPLQIMALVFFFTGMAFKLSLVPFHLWTADVYEGAPSTVTAYLSVISKGSAAFVLMAILIKVFAPMIHDWQEVLYWVTIASITIANIFAIRQQNLKRLMAFSSISQAGYIMLGVIGGTAQGMTLQEELFFSAFHSVSAFCNAGFSTLPGGMGNPAVMQGHNLLYITLGLLIALGGIGFPILVNLYETVAYYLQAGKFWLLRRSGRFRKKVHLYNLNTKIVLVATVFLLIGGTLAIAALEWNHSFAGMPVADKWVHAFFNSSCPRTAGFASVGLTSLSTQTLLLMVVLMMIGGGTQSTAGGVKVNVFAVVLINLWAVVRGADRVAILRRELSHDSIRRSNAALILYLFMVFLAIFLLSVLEPEAGLLVITFECVSALSTVGSSLDLTPTLGNSSKLLVILLMYIGRVGAFTLLTGLVRQEKKRNYRYPSDNIIIN